MAQVSNGGFCQIELRKAGIFPETEGSMFAIQDQVIPTRNCRRVMLKGTSRTPVEGVVHGERLYSIFRIGAPEVYKDCLLYTSPSPRDRTRSRMPSSA